MIDNTMNMIRIFYSKNALTYRSVSCLTVLSVLTPDCILWYSLSCTSSGCIGVITRVFFIKSTFTPSKPAIYALLHYSKKSDQFLPARVTSRRSQLRTSSHFFTTFYFPLLLAALICLFYLFRNNLTQEDVALMLMVIESAFFKARFSP